MSEKEVIPQDNNDIMSLIWKYAKTTTLGNIIAGFAIVILVLQLSGLSVGTIVDKRFGLKQTESEQTYQLQLKTFELIEGKVMSKLEDMQEDITALKEDFSDMRGDVKTLTERVDGLEKKVGNIEEENAIVHAVWRKNNEK